MRAWSSRLVLLTVGLTLLLAGGSVSALLLGRVQPHSSTLAFFSQQHASNEIYLLDLGRALMHRVTHHHSADHAYGSLRWSPDGTQLAYVEAHRGGFWKQVFTLNLDCENDCPRDDTAVTYAETANFDPVWVPKQRSLLFVSDRDLNNEIYLLDLASNHLLNLTNNPADDYGPSISPDGTQVAFVSERERNSEIYVMCLDQQETCREPRNLSQHHGVDFAPTWSPDGKQIAFISDRTWNYDLFVMDANGENMRNLTSSHGEEWFPVWSPDGQYIAFVSDRPGNYEIYTANVRTGRIDNVTNHLAGDIAAAWSADSQQIAFMSNRDGNYNIYLVNRDGSNLQRITHNGGENTWPVWQPSR